MSLKIGDTVQHKISRERGIVIGFTQDKYKINLWFRQREPSVFDESQTMVKVCCDFTGFVTVPQFILEKINAEVAEPIKAVSTPVDNKPTTDIGNPRRYNEEKLLEERGYTKVPDKEGIWVKNVKIGDRTVESFEFVR